MIRIALSEDNAVHIAPPDSTLDVENAAFAIFGAIQLLAVHIRKYRLKLLRPDESAGVGLDPVWLIAWVDGPAGWAESYAVGEGASGQKFTTYAYTPCTLAVAALN